MHADYKTLYTEYHKKKPSKFSGYSVVNYADKIAELVESIGAKTILDYGCGKGFQYLRDRIHETWGGILPHCYDIGVPQISRVPPGQYDGIICTDVLEHIHPLDVDTVLKDIFSRTRIRAFVFLVICCRPAKKVFKDGSNVHLTIEPPEWWDEKLEQHRREGLELVIYYDTKVLCDED